MSKHMTSAVCGRAPAAADAYQQLGALTRQLHDALERLGISSKLQHAADRLPDARDRLSYIAEKTRSAAETVLNAVDEAKLERRMIADASRAIVATVVADPVKAVTSGAIARFVENVEQQTAKIDSHLTDIMLAQDFQDLTGQVVAKVVTLAHDLENGLLKLLVQTAPAELAPAPSPSELSGPVVNPEGRTDVVTDQSEVDDLLASLGF